MAGIFASIFTKFPISRGMVMYAVLWPSSDLCRQLASSRIQTDKRNNSTVDISRLVRFSLFGTFWDAPTFFAWVKFTSKLLPGCTLTVAVLKTFIEQFTFGPASIVCFYFGMKILDKKNTTDALLEVEDKFLPTWKSGLAFWPIIQTFNYAVIPERNRVVFVGMASFIWTAYLSYMEANSF